MSIEKKDSDNTQHLLDVFLNIYEPCKSFSEADDLKSTIVIQEIFMNLGYNIDVLKINSILTMGGFVRQNVGLDFVWLLKSR